MESSGNDHAAISPKPSYLFIEDVEELEKYCPGGFHPITIGDHLHGRYWIVHKLGFGSYSTVWLAWDESANRYVAIKIAIAGGPGSDFDDSQESTIIAGIRQLESKGCMREFPMKSIIFPPLDEFFHTGPNGKHRCLVTRPAKMTIADAKEAGSGLFQLPVARVIAAQIILAVSFLHSHGIVHAGIRKEPVIIITCFYSTSHWLIGFILLDINPCNILLPLPQSFLLDSMSPEELYTRFNRPELEPVERFDYQPLPEGVPRDVVRLPLWLGTESELLPLSEAEIYLADFGESFAPSDHSTSRFFRPPEAFFLPKEHRSFPSDIWALACTIWEILANHSLFDDLDGRGRGDCRPCRPPW